MAGFSAYEEEYATASKTSLIPWILLAVVTIAGVWGAFALSGQRDAALLKLKDTKESLDRASRAQATSDQARAGLEQQVKQLTDQNTDLQHSKADLTARVEDLTRQAQQAQASSAKGGKKGATTAKGLTSSKKPKHKGH
jgi:septal ring factor EnvC (AmiA/AmiB activator)